jgi:hypothetical protein
LAAVSKDVQRFKQRSSETYSASNLHHHPSCVKHIIVHHEGTKNTKDTKDTKERNYFILSYPELFTSSQAMTTTSMITFPSCLRVFVVN